MSLTIETFVGGPIDTNSYLVFDDQTRDAMIVDAPQGTTADLVAAVTRHGLALQFIVLTHAHWDHIVDAKQLQATTRVPLLAHPLAKDRLANPGSKVFDLPFTIEPVQPDRFLNDGDEVRIGNHTFRVFHLPGHDPAHIVLFSEADRVFLGGDVVFPGGHGTTEIPGSNQATMDESLRRVAQLPPDTVVYPGHGRTTTVGEETAWLPTERPEDRG